MPDISRLFPFRLLRAAAVGLFAFAAGPAFAACELYCNGCDNVCDDAKVQEERERNEIGLGRYRALVRDDSEFAATERAYLETKTDFLRLFADDTLPDIDSYFDTDWLEGSYRWFAEGDAAGREFYIERQRKITRYMRLVLDNRDRPLPLFYLIAERAMSAPLFRDVTQKELDAAGFSDVVLLPDGGVTLKSGHKFYVDNRVGNDFSHFRSGFYTLSHEIRSFGNEIWGISRSEGSSRVLLMRWIKGGRISLFDFPAFAMDDLFPSGGAPAPDTAIAEKMPVPVAECRQRSYYRIDASQSPPLVVAEIEQAAEEDIAYRCLAECSLPFVWTGTHYMPGEKSCLPEGRWGVFSPFSGNTLIPFEEAYMTVASRNRRLARHDRELDDAWKAYAALFGGDSRSVVRSIFREWRQVRQIVLHPFRLKDDEAFVDAVIAFDETALRHMKTVAVLMKTPDARLLAVLDPLHRIGELRAIKKHAISVAFVVEEEEPVVREYLAAPFSADIAESLRILGGKEKNRQEYDDEGTGAATITLKRSEDNDRIVYENEKRYDSKKRTYTAYRAGKGRIWGLSTWYVGFEANRYGGIARNEGRITLVDEGKIHLLTPELPPQDAFPGGGMKPTEQQMKQAVEEDDGRNACRIRPVIKADAVRVPFAVYAVPMQTNAYSSAGVWQCEPRCAIPFHWNEAGKRYERGGVDCRE